jgi:Tfp pilus assembly protein PilF
MKRLWILMIVVGGFVVGMTWNTPSTVAEPMSSSDVVKPGDVQKAEFEAAFARFRSRDFDGALKLVQEIVKKNPDYPPPNLIIAQWFGQANIPAGVRNALERTVIEEPSDPEAYLIMGEMALRERRFTEAQLLYDKANDVMAKWKGSENRRKEMLPRIPAGLAATAINRGNWADAKINLEAWLKLDPKSAVAMQQLAQCLFQLKKVEGEGSALEMLRAAAKIEKNMMLPETVVAQWYMQSGEQDNAGKWLKNALTTAPKDVKTRLIAAQWAWENGRLDEADQQAAIAIQLEPKSLDGKILRGIIALFQKDFKSAEMFFESANIQSPGNFAASNNLALALVEQDDNAKKQRALEYAESNVRQYAKSNDTRAATESTSTYGWVLYRLGRHEEAEKWLKSSVSNQSLSAETAYYLACVLVDHGQEADAQKLLEGALSSKSPFAFRPEAKKLLESLKTPKKTK